MVVRSGVNQIKPSLTARRIASVTRRAMIRPPASTRAGGCVKAELQREEDSVKSCIWGCQEQVHKSAGDPNKHVTWPGCAPLASPSMLEGGTTWLLRCWQETTAGRQRTAHPPSQRKLSFAERMAPNASSLLAPGGTPRAARMAGLSACPGRVHRARQLLMYCA